MFSLGESSSAAAVSKQGKQQANKKPKKETGFSSLPSIYLSFHPFWLTYTCEKSEKRENKRISGNSYSIFDSVDRYFVVSRGIFSFRFTFLFENTQSNGWIDRTSVLSEISERVEREPDERGFFEKQNKKKEIL